MKIMRRTLRYGSLALISSVLLILIFSTFNSEAQSGSALVVNAIATPFVAQPNNSNSAALYVTVQSNAGLLSGLEEGTGIFSISTEELPTAGCRVAILNIRTSVSGVYRLDIVPANSGCSWERGRYVLAVRVNAGSMSGAALAELQFD